MLGLRFRVHEVVRTARRVAELKGDKPLEVLYRSTHEDQDGHGIIVEYSIFELQYFL